MILRNLLESTIEIIKDYNGKDKDIIDYNILILRCRNYICNIYNCVFSYTQDYIENMLKEGSSSY